MSGKELKSVRAHFTELIRQKGYSPEDLQKYREISNLARVAIDKGALDCSNPADVCSAVVDKCFRDEACGYDDGGCGTDECCNWCDSCMVLWDSCGGDEEYASEER